MPAPYPQEFRDRVLARAAEPGTTDEGVAREFGINPNSIRNWRKRRAVDDGDQPGVTSDERAELHRLRRENARLREERDILRKAAAFFANEDRSR